MKRLFSATKKIINHVSSKFSSSSDAREKTDIAEKHEIRPFFKEEKFEFASNKFKKSFRRVVRNGFNFINNNRMYVITVAVLFGIIILMGSRLTGMSFFETSLESCDENYNALASESSDRISNLEVGLNKCNSELTTNKAEFSRVTNSMSNLTDEFVACYSNIQSLGSINSECSNDLTECRNDIISMGETVEEALENEANAVDALGTTQADYAKAIENYAKFKCCILKLNDFTISYYYVSENQVLCTSSSSDTTIPLSC